jgi:hypothetical protein
MSEFWIHNPRVLWKEYLDFYPKKTHDGNGFYNAMTRLLLYITASFVVFERDISYLVLLLILVNILGIVSYKPEPKVLCREPSLNNPMMNALLTNDDLGLKACEGRRTDDLLLYGVKSDSRVLYRNKLMRRSFITQAVSSYPNDTKQFGEQVYGGMMSGCKTANKDCKTYRDIRFYR